MFGQPDDQQVGAGSGASSAHDPAMLDNVAQQQQAQQPQQYSAQPPPQTSAHPNPTFSPVGSNQPSPAQPIVNQPVPAAPAQQIYEPPSDHTHHYQPHDDSAQQGQQQSPPPQNGSVDLQRLRREAMHELEGLVDKIGGDPEQVFRTTMMMIQANNNAGLLERALQAAKSIPDDKVRAEALMDVVSEINFFSQSASVDNQ